MDCAPENYKLVKTADGEILDIVQRLNDTAFIPMDPANKDYQEYLEWLAEGNEPLPADEPS